MTDNEFDYDDWEDRIGDYLNNKLTDTDRQQFELDMAQVEGLKDAVEFDSVLKNQAKEQALFQHLKPKIDTYIQDNIVKNEEIDKSVTPKHSLSMTQIFGILGLILFSILGVLLFKRIQKTNTQSELISKWLTNKPIAYENTNLAAFQTGADSAAIEAYKTRKYAEAEAFFRQNDVKGANEFGPRGLYRAINAMMVKPPNTTIAIQILENRFQNKNTFQYDAVAWYLALAYVQNKDFKASKKVLETIGNNSEYFNNAQTLLDEMK